LEAKEDRQEVANEWFAKRDVAKAAAEHKAAERRTAKAEAKAETETNLDYKELYETLSHHFAVTSDRKLNLLIELAAQQQRSFPLTIHQFMRLGDEWWDDKFKKKLGYKATALHKKLFGGKLPAKVRISIKVGDPKVDLTGDASGERYRPLPARHPRTNLRSAGRGDQGH
jgi:hypothetical protein